MTRASCHEKSIHVLKAFQDVVDCRPQTWIPDQDILQEVDQVHVIVDAIELAVLKEVKLSLCQPHKEPCVLISIEEHIACKQLIEKASQAPNIGQAACSDTLASVEFVSVSSLVEFELDHLG